MTVGYILCILEQYAMYCVLEQYALYCICGTGLCTVFTRTLYCVLSEQIRLFLTWQVVPT